MQVRPSPAPSPRANASGCGVVAAWRSWAGRRWTSTPVALALLRPGASPADVPERSSPGLQTRATGSTSQTLGVVEGAWGSAALTHEVAPGGTYTSVLHSLPSALPPQNHYPHLGRNMPHRSPSSTDVSMLWVLPSVLACQTYGYQYQNARRES